MNAYTDLPGSFFPKRHPLSSGDAEHDTPAWKLMPGMDPASGLSEPDTDAATVPSDAPAPWNHDPFPEPRTFPSGWDLSELTS